MGGDTADGDSEPVTSQRRGRLVLLAALVMLVVALAGIGLRLYKAHLTFPYDGPSMAVQPGDVVEIRAPGEMCGPLIVSLHSPSILGQWNQTHSGNAINDAFRADDRPWWSFSSRSHFTPVPCPSGGTIRFTLPTDVTGSVVAACDVDQRCAKIHVEHSRGE